MVEQVLQALDVQTISANKRSKLASVLQEHQKRVSQENVKLSTQLLRLEPPEPNQTDPDPAQITSLESQLFQLEQ